MFYFSATVWGRSHISALSVNISCFLADFSILSRNSKTAYKLLCTKLFILWKATFIYGVTEPNDIIELINCLPGKPYSKLPSSVSITHYCICEFKNINRRKKESLFMSFWQLTREDATTTDRPPLFHL